jgi:hypothetical protein
MTITHYIHVSIMFQAALAQEALLAARIEHAAARGLQGGALSDALALPLQLLDHQPALLNARQSSKPGLFWRLCAAPCCAKKSLLYIYLLSHISDSPCSVSMSCPQVWYLHGLAFHVVDAILLLDIRSVAGALSKRLHAYWLYREATHRLQHAFPDAWPNNDEPCSICMEPMSRAKQLPCGHTFHLACLRAWVQQGGPHASSFTCPNCRQPMLMENEDGGAAGGGAGGRRGGRMGPVLRAVRWVDAVRISVLCQIGLYILLALRFCVHRMVRNPPHPHDAEVLQDIEQHIMMYQQVSERGQGCNVTLVILCCDGVTGGVRLVAEMCSIALHHQGQREARMSHIVHGNPCIHCQPPPLPVCIADDHPRTCHAVQPAPPPQGSGRQAAPQEGGQQGGPRPGPLVTRGPCRTRPRLRQLSCCYLHRWWCWAPHPFRRAAARIAGGRGHHRQRAGCGAPAPPPVGPAAGPA